MVPAARIQAVIEMLAEVLATPRPADTLASAYFRNRRFIGSKDRQAISTRLFRTMREYHRLSWWIMRAGCEVTARTLIIAAVMIDREHNLTSIDSCFSGDGYAPAKLDDTERKLLAVVDGQKLEHPEMPMRERLECPEWAFESLQAVLGDSFEKEMSVMLLPAPLDLRVNTIKATRDEILDELKKDGIDAHAGKTSPLCIRVFGRPPISQHELFREGYFEIQDEGSQMVSIVADAKPGEQVVDFCAGAGGKTLALGASMENKGRLVAMDVSSGRLVRARERFKRAGLHNVETRELTSERDKFVKKHEGHFDLVLIDAPCTGTGTWRRDPDKRWRQLGPGLVTLVPLQKNILESAMRMVKPGGRLVYATCSLLPEENEGQIDSFLKDHAEFSRGRDDLKLTPAKNDTDGFYAAVLVRKGGKA